MCFVISMSPYMIAIGAALLMARSRSELLLSVLNFNIATLEKMSLFWLKLTIGSLMSNNAENGDEVGGNAHAQCSASSMFMWTPWCATTGCSVENYQHLLPLLILTEHSLSI